MVGSPLAVFFSLRGFRPGEETEKAVIPQIVCRRLFNIYDQCDPVVRKCGRIQFHFVLVTVTLIDLNITTQKTIK